MLMSDMADTSLGAATPLGRMPSLAATPSNCATRALRASISLPSAKARAALPSRALPINRFRAAGFKQWDFFIIYFGFVLIVARRVAAGKPFLPAAIKHTPVRNLRRLTLFHA